MHRPISGFSTQMKREEHVITGDKTEQNEIQSSTSVKHVTQNYSDCFSVRMLTNTNIEHDRPDTRTQTVIRQLEYVFDKDRTHRSWKISKICCVRIKPVKKDFERSVYSAKKANTSRLRASCNYAKSF